MVKIIQGCDVLESYNGLYHRAVQADRDHFSRQFDTWLDKICTHLQSGESLRGLVSLSTKNYVGKKTKALLELMDIKGVRTIGALAVRLLEKFDMLRVRVSMDESGTCPYCEKVMGVTEGVSGMYPNGVCTIWCVNCGGAYYYVDEAIKDNYIKSQKSVEVNMSKKIKINTKVPVGIMLTVINPGGSDNCYDNKAPIDWDVDDFVGYVSDHMKFIPMICPEGEIALDEPLLKAIFKSKVTMDMLNGGSGLNGNVEFKRYDTWRAALYDIWECVLRDSVNSYKINRVRDTYNKQMAVIDGYLYDLTRSVARLKESYEKKLESQPDSWAGIGGGTELGKLEYDLRACLDFVSSLKF